VNYAYGVAGGLSDTIKMTTTMSSLVLALFFVGYTLFQIPAQVTPQSTVQEADLLGADSLGRSLCDTGTGQNPLDAGGRADGSGRGRERRLPWHARVLDHWFTKRERSTANTLLIIGNPLTMTTVSVISGFLIDYFDRHRWVICRAGR